MTDQPPRVTELDLLAYVDDRLDPARRQDVEAHLMQHPEDAARVHEYRSQAWEIRKRLDPILAEPIPPQLLATGTPAVVSRRPAPTSRSHKRAALRA